MKDIFVIGTHIDNQEKEDTLVNLIKNLRRFNVPILLVGHYPINPSVQKLADYYLFDADNPVLLKYDFAKYNLLFSKIWAETADWRMEFAINSTDYAVWSSMRNAVNFVKYLGKDCYYYIDYDSDPDFVQYENEFMKPIKDHDAVVLHMPHIPHFYMSYIYSFHTDLGMKIFNQVRTIEEYYATYFDPFYIEHALLRSVNSMAKNIYLSQYKSNNRDLNIHTHCEGKVLTHYLLSDENEDLYIHFRMRNDIVNFTILVDYMGVKQNHILNYPYTISDNSGGYNNEFIVKIGKYKVGETVDIYYDDIRISTTTLDIPHNIFSYYNTIKIKT